MKFILSLNLSFEIWIFYQLLIILKQTQQQNMKLFLLGALAAVGSTLKLDQEHEHIF